MGKINAEWHLAHPMPKRPTDEQRIEWHLEHARNCTCREPTKGVIELMRKHGVQLPQGRADG